MTMSPQPSADPSAAAPAAAVPHHLAVIMDGNRRWAELRGLPPEKGWREGEERLYELTRSVAEKGVSVLSVFAFSSENWRRSESQVKKLLSQVGGAIERRQRELLEQGVQVRFAGYRERLPAADRRAVERIERSTANPPNLRLQLTVAFDYSGQWDLLTAVQQIAAEVKQGQLEPQAIDKADLERHTQIRQPVDLLIRTGGEQRISNFILWQLAYSELYFTACLWPDFGESELKCALAAFGRRQRRFGAEG